MDIRAGCRSIPDPGCALSEPPTAKNLPTGIPVERKPVATGDTVTLDYAVPTDVAFRLRDTSGNAVVSLSDQAVTNNTTGGGGGGGTRSDEQKRVP